MDIFALSREFGVHAEEGRGGDFPEFLARMRGKKVMLLTDENTLPLALPLKAALEKVCFVKDCHLLEPEPVADEATVGIAKKSGDGCDYLLAAGAGTLNDVAKYAGSLLHRPSGIFATAPSMDGFTSGVTPLIEHGFKITRPAQVAQDVLMDFSVLSAAPRRMIGAGVGDILAKYCCLADWRISAHLTGEKYDARSAALMGEAVRAMDESLPALKAGGEEGIRRLMDALLISGYAMVIAGNSRPASGAEHHMSHFLEMDFLARGARIPLHGVKVGLGTLVSLYLYHTIGRRPAFAGCEAVYAEAEGLPPVARIAETLSALGCPTRFSELGIPRETFRAMLKDAYRIRDRFTILTLYCTYGFMTDEVIAELEEEFY